MTTDKIPYGPYCYRISSVDKVVFITHVCPYWSKDHTKPDEMNGYCSYLKCGDWEHEGIGLLWDQVKECGVNEEIEEEDG